MPWNGSLYVKGMDNESESEEDDENEDVWDDRNLINAYDKGMKLANLEVAKRIAMTTNTQTENESSQKIAKKEKKQQPQKKAMKLKWAVGMPCKAFYDEDGLEYEARIISIVNGGECIIQFSDYDNLQKVKLSSLLPVSRDEANKKEPTIVDESFESQSSCDEEAACIDSVKAHIENARSPKKKKKQQKPGNNSFTLPDIPMPDFDMITSLGGMDLPFPPPPPELGVVENEQQAVTSMLLSWYMSGYYTGVYQGMKQARGEEQN